MFNQLKMRQLIGSQLIRAGQLIIPNFRSRNVSHELEFNNPFIAGLYRRGRLIKTVRGHNGVTVVGKNHLLDVVFGNSSPVTQVDPWYIGLINNSPTPVLSENDILSSHAGWTEWTAYSGSRKTWDDANAANKIKAASTVSTFVINTSGTVFGILVASVASGTSGILWATGGFDTTLDVINNDEIKVSYGVRL